MPRCNQLTTSGVLFYHAAMKVIDGAQHNLPNVCSRYTRVDSDYASFTSYSYAGSATLEVSLRD
ncbi:MAG: hypothetical protein R2839_09395 [Thermomicrobiales bacterium]